MLFSENFREHKSKTGRRTTKGSSGEANVRGGTSKETLPVRRAHARRSIFPKLFVEISVDECEQCNRCGTSSTRNCYRVYST